MSEDHENQPVDQLGTDPDDGIPGSAIGTTVSGLARLAGVARTTVQGWTRAADFPPRLKDGSINPYTVGVWWRDRQISKALQANGADPFLAGGNSPALEEYRKQRAILAYFDVQERRGTLIDREHIREILAELAKLRRRFNVDLQRLFGPEAHKLSEECLKEELTFIEAHFANLDNTQTNQTPFEPSPSA